MISFFRQAVMLAFSSGVASVLFIYLALLGKERSPLHLDPGMWANFTEFVGFFVWGFILCAIFGTPFLYLIDKYCPKARFRYVLGGAIAGWFMWFILASPLFTPDQWFFAKQWYLNYDNWSLVYTSAGLYTGMVYSVVLWCVERWLKNRSRNNDKT